MKFNSCLILITTILMLPLLAGGATPAGHSVNNRLSPITCWGDSLTQNGIAVALAKVYAGVRQVNNQGVGGEPSTAIAVRQGGTPVGVIFPDNLMPASGTATVTVVTVNGDPKIRHAIKGSIHDVEGTLSRSIKTGVYTWTRAHAGNALAIAPETVMTVDTNHAEDDTVVLWYGRNNVNTDKSAEMVKGDLKRSIAHLAAKNKRFIVMGITRSDYAAEYIGAARARRINALNAWIKAQWPDHYFETMDYLLAARDPNNAQDGVDTRHGVIPFTLRRAGDKTHLNPQGDLLIAKELKKVIDKNGW